MSCATRAQVSLLALLVQPFSLLALLVQAISLLALLEVLWLASRACVKHVVRREGGGVQFTCFTSAKVQILTAEARSCVPWHTFPPAFGYL
jgi:hypothetical protein